MARATCSAKWQAESDRPGARLRRLLDQLAAGDVLMVTRLDRLAEFERDLSRARTNEGRDRAKTRDAKLGRKPKLTEHQKREAIRRRGSDGKPVREIARSYNVSHSTIAPLAAYILCLHAPNNGPSSEVFRSARSAGPPRKTRLPTVFSLTGRRWVFHETFARLSKISNYATKIQIVVERKTAPQGGAANAARP